MPYAMSGTKIGCAASGRGPGGRDGFTTAGESYTPCAQAHSGVDLRSYSRQGEALRFLSRIFLRARYAVSGTEAVYAATRSNRCGPSCTWTGSRPPSRKKRLHAIACAMRCPERA
eukprot:458184-Rhodomonas_salina.2